MASLRVSRPSDNTPGATAITFAGVITFIFATRYIPLVRLTLKGLWTILGGEIEVKK